MITTIATLLFLSIFISVFGILYIDMYSKFGRLGIKDTLITAFFALAISFGLFSLVILIFI